MNTETLMHAETTALQLAGAGLAIFPLRPGTKVPFADEGIRIATTDAATIRRWFVDRPSMNYGVATGSPSGDLLVLDADVKNGNGLAALDRLDLPPSFRVWTPSGGAHVYLRGVTASQAKVFGPLIDVRSAGGYVVGPGCRTAAGEYFSLDAPIVLPVPPHIAERLRAPKPKAADADMPPTGGWDNDLDVEAARQFLEDQPPAIEGRGGYDQTMGVTRQLRDKGISAEMAIELMLDHWSDRCDPPWTLEELSRKVPQWYAGTQLPAGTTSITDFADVDTTPPAEASAGASLIETAADIDLEGMVAAGDQALIRPFLEPGQLSVLYGESGSGKSFAAMHMGWHIAIGRDWCDYKVRRAPVLYVALEGQSGIRRRMLAHEAEFGAAGPWFARMMLQPRLAQQGGSEGVQQILAAIAEQTAACGQATGLVIIDTLARAIPGDDENAAGVMGSFVEKRLGVIQRKTGAAVQIVHHAGQSGAIRGSTVLFASADLVLRVTRRGDERRLSAEKVKDGDEGDLCDFRIEGRTLYARPEDGFELRSGVASVAPPSGQSRPAPKLPRTAAALWECIENAARTEAAHPTTGEVGATVDGKEVRDSFRQFNSGRQAWRRAFADITKYNLAEELASGRVWFRPSQ